MPKVAREVALRRREGESRDVPLTLLGKIRVDLRRLPILPEPRWGPSWLISTSSASEASFLSSSLSCGVVADSFGDQAMMNTPANVAVQPYKNVIISWNLAVLKS